MTDDPVYYQPPAAHEHHIRGLIRFLIVFFAALITVVTLIVLNAQSLAQKLPFSAEKRFVEGIERTVAGFVDGQRDANALSIERYLQALADELAVNMSVPEDFTITVHLLKSDEINAFATLGGHLFVLSGLIEALPDENSLAMVIAHEIGHVRHRDPLAGLGRGVALQIIYSFLTGQASTSTDLAAYGGNIGLMFFSREQEELADLAAIEGLHSTYGHVAGSATLFRVLADSADTDELQFPDWLSTHPQHEARVQALDSYAAERGWSSGMPRAYPPGIIRGLESL